MVERVSALCVLPGGEMFVLDNHNNVTLLDQQYQVVSHCNIDAVPRDVGPIEKITPREVALTLGNSDIQFITVIPRQRVAGRTIQIRRHECICITHHRGDLFITSDTALYKYTLSGRQISKLYEGNSEYWTMWKCAVSPTGDKLFIIHRYEHKLLTLASDETVLATFRDPDLHYTGALHVTPAGQLLVGCGISPCRIIQVHGEGSRKLALLAELGANLWGLVSVCYNSTASSIIVGKLKSILVLKVY